MLQVEGRRREVLKQSATQAKGMYSLGKGRYRQEGQGQHGGGTRGTDVPLEAPTTR
jgi:hypothetical protein